MKKNEKKAPPRKMEYAALPPMEETPPTHLEASEEDDDEVGIVGSLINAVAASTLRALVDIRRFVQKKRIANGLSMGALERGSDQAHGTDNYKLLQKWYRYWCTLEREASKDVEQEVKTYAIYEAMSSVVGVGPMLGAQIICPVNIERADTTSKLWRYAGYGQGEYWVKDVTDAKGKVTQKVMAPKSGLKWVEKPILSEEEKKEKDKLEAQGRKYFWPKIMVREEAKPEKDWVLKTMRDVPVEGWIICYNKRMKSALWNWITGCIKASGKKSVPYADYYRKVKEQSYQHAAHQHWKPGHHDLHAKRVTIKLFLSHMHLVWRKLEGLPTRDPYPVEHQGHTTIIKPEEMGWTVPPEQQNPTE